MTDNLFVTCLERTPATIDRGASDVDVTVRYEVENQTGYDIKVDMETSVYADQNINVKQTDRQAIPNGDTKQFSVTLTLAGVVDPIDSEISVMVTAQGTYPMWSPAGSSAVARALSRIPSTR